MLYKSLPFIYHLHFTNSRDANEFKRFSCSLQHQYSNYSNSNTSRTPVEPSKVPLGTSTTTSTIKIGEVTFFFFSAFRQTPPLQPLVQDPRSATPLARHPLLAITDTHHHLLGSSMPSPTVLGDSGFITRVLPDTRYLSDAPKDRMHTGNIFLWLGSYFPSVHLFVTKVSFLFLEQY